MARIEDTSTNLGIPYGALSSLAGGALGGYLVADTIEHRRIVIPAPLDADGVRALMAPDAVLIAARSVDEGEALSPIEARVLAVLDGKRPVARVGHLTGLAADDLHVVIAMLAAKRLVTLGGVVERRDPVIRPAARPLGKRARAHEARTEQRVAPRVDPVTPAEVPAAEMPRRPVAPRSARHLAADAQRALDDGDLERAERLVRAVIAKAPASASARAKLAVVLARRKQLRAAYNASIEACELAPENTTYRANMLKLLAALERT